MLINNYLLLLAEVINPLKLDTVTFSGFYILIALICGLAAFTLRYWWWIKKPENLDSSKLFSISLNEYEIAYLADGQSRAINMASINLVRRGYLHVHPNNGKIEVTRKIPNQSHILEKAVYSKYSNIIDNNNHNIIDQSIDGVQQNLQHIGLIYKESQSRLVLRWLSTFPIFVMVLLGFFKTISELLENKFSPIAIIWVVVTIAACFLLSKPHRTKYGDRYLRELQQCHIKLKQIETLNNLSSARTKEFINLNANTKSEQLALAFALFGEEVLAAKPFKVVESYFNPPHSETDEHGLFKFHHRKTSK